MFPLWLSKEFKTKRPFVNLYFFKERLVFTHLEDIIRLKEMKDSFEWISFGGQIRERIFLLLIKYEVLSYIASSG
jgi:hypothetical protein